MKKIYQIAAVALAPLCAFAQPQVTQANVPTSLSANLYYADVQNLDPGQAGQNVTWDFSGVGAVNVGQMSILPASGTPYANTYPAADHCYLYHSSTNDLWYYNRISAQKMETISLVFPQVVAINYTHNPVTVVEFPYTYNQVFTDSYGQNSQDLTTFTATYDGYGTLVLPFGTYQNVIRQKVVQDGITEYNWFNSNPFFPLMQTNLEEGSVGMTEPTNLSTGNPGVSFKPGISPNPFTDSVELRLPDAISDNATVRVTDLLGHTVFSKALQGVNAGDVVAINLSGCAPGVYLLQLSDDRHQGIAQKIVRQ